MSYFETLQISLSVGDKIDALWNFFLLIHVGIIAPLAFYKGKISRSFVVLFSVGYLMFTVLNVVAFIDTYRLFGHMVSDLKTLSQGGVSSVSLYVMESFNFSIEKAIAIVCISHFVSTSILFVTLKSRYQAQ